MDNYKKKMPMAHTLRYIASGLTACQYIISRVGHGRFLFVYL